MKSSHILFWITLMCSTSLQVVSQPCQTKGITTNPDSPVNNEKPSKLNTFFDWRASSYNIHSSTIQGSTIDSPFDQSNNLNVSYFLNDKDRLPENGWELIKYETGYNEDGTPKSSQVTTIHLVLYNKYTGVLRVFVAGAGVNYNGAKMEISFNPSGTDQMSSVLSSASEIFALDSFENDPTVAAVSQYTNDTGKWFYADFQMGYDPCTCLFESSLVIQVKLIDSSDISITGSYSATLTSMTNNTVTVADNGYSFKDLLSQAQKSQKTYQGIDKFATGIEKSLGISTKTDNQLNTEEKNKRNALNKLKDALAKSDFLKEGLKAAPYIGTAVELVDFFISGGKKSPAPQSVKVMPMSMNGTIALSGTLSATYNYGDITFYTPGSLYTATKDSKDYPYYNEVLGIFNLLTTPIINSKYMVNETVTGTQGNSNYERTVEHSYLFQLPQNISYVLNPASGLRSDNIDIMASLIFKKNGEEIRRTAFVPISDITQFSLEFGYEESETFYDYVIYPLSCGYDPDEVSLQLLVNMQRANSDANTQNVLLSAVYPVGISNAPSFSYSSVKYCDYSTNLTLSNTSSGSRSAWGHISIGPNVSFNSSSTIKAGQGVTIIAGTTITPNTTIKAYSPLGVPGSTFLAQQSSGAVSAFCNSSSYDNPNRIFARTNYEKPEMETKEPVSRSYGMSLYPNPASDAANFAFQLPEASSAKLYITDVSGRIIEMLLDRELDKGAHEYQYNNLALPDGIYICVLESKHGRLAKKLVVKN
ncbi:MAG: T9SS type A sorting domain-containing protein [Imperialibacter sp.]|uniref:T9SS type A sorting domain-containing protein n=1 Tax=Imperialibacter sp. TaxID=2038411 RepID=UPI003A8568EA